VRVDAALSTGEIVTHRTPCIESLRASCLALVLLFPLWSHAADVRDVEAVPHLDSTGQDGYRAFLAARKHRAFAIAPGGTWFWMGEGNAADAVAEDALQLCENDSGRSCLLYAVDDKVVFDARAWSRSWGPYLDRQAAGRAQVGNELGRRFFDLAFKDASGKQMSLGALRGKVVVLHFWGSWCPPCRHEMPELQRLQRALDKSSDIRLVMLQVRESHAVARRWLQQQKLQMSFYDSGAQDSRSDSLPLADGKTVHDRYIAPVFPTTYVLGKHGIVVFANHGPLAHWEQYLPLLRDVAKRSGK
jgi:thiol-disulfide isomerase/thioredoxin